MRQIVAGMSGCVKQTVGFLAVCSDTILSKLVKQWPGDAIRLNAYDAEAGAVDSTGNAVSGKLAGLRTEMFR